MSEHQRVVDAFTDMAPHYEQTVDRELRQFWGLGYEEFIGRLLDRASLAGVTTLLDVATGRAAIPRALMRRSEWRGSVVGLDITPEMLSGARAVVGDVGSNGPVALVCGSGMRLPFAAASFDATVCALATHHMDVLALLTEMRRVLTSGALVLLADVATAPFWHSRTGRLWLRAMIGWYGITQGGARVRAEIDALDNMIGPEQWQKLLLQAGFVDINLAVLPARRRWYPSGLLMTARAG